MPQDRNRQTHDTSAAPESSLAERAKALLSRERIGSLSTMSQKHQGWPFGSMMPYALDTRGAPIFFISTMAMHTKNLVAEPRASLMVTDANADGDPLGAARVTVMGRALRAPQEERAALRDLYLARHPTAREWMDFGDFAFYRMEIVDIYYVGGFGVMGWVAAGDYQERQAR
nr:pyridoxamine 5'-phosphate oxidase family protein [Nitrospirota bacterium]